MIAPPGPGATCPRCRCWAHCDKRGASLGSCAAAGRAVSGAGGSGLGSVLGAPCASKSERGTARARVRPLPKPPCASCATGESVGLPRFCSALGDRGEGACTQKGGDE